MSYAMFSAAGDRAVDLVTKEILNQLMETNDLPDLDTFQISKIIYRIEERVEKMGISQINPSKYDSDQVEGFEEVHDTAVRDNIYVKIQEFIIEHRRSVSSSNHSIRFFINW